MAKFKLNQRVKVSTDNDNENYDSFRDKILIITHVATSSNDHPGYDSGMDGEGLYDFVTEAGEDVHSSLYDYELIRA